MAGHPIQLVAGDDETWTFQFNRGGLYTVGNALSVVVWRGEDQAEVATGMTAAHVDTDMGTFSVTAPGSGSLALSPGIYDMLVEVAVGSGKRTAWKGEVEVIGRPGTGSMPAVYCTSSDLEAVQDNISRFRGDEDDLAGFAKQRHWAWADINQYLIARYNPQPGFVTRRSTGAFNFATGFEVQDVVTVPPTIDVIRTRLAAGGLVLTPPDDSLISLAAAKLAVAHVLGRQDHDARLVERARVLREEVADMLYRYRAYVDIDGDGVADVLIDRNCCFLD